MALVAYGSSDESEAEEDEEQTPVVSLLPQNDQPQTVQHCNGVESEEEEKLQSPEPILQSSRTFSLPPPKVSQTNSVLIEDKPKQRESDRIESVPDDDVWEDDPYLMGDLGVNSEGILSELPAPLVVPSQLKAELPSANAEDEVEDLNELKRKFAPKDEIVDKKASEEPVTKKTCKERKPVRITVPSLSEFDEEEEERTKKKTTPSVHRSGLFDLLPPPKHETKKITNRVLIPHTLTKPKVVPKPKVIPKKVQTKETVSDDDEDDDSSLDFFSLSKTEEVLEGPVDLPEETPRAVGPTIPHHLRKKKMTLPPAEEAATFEISSSSSHQPEEPSTSKDLELSEDVLLRLQGATTRRTGKEEINIVEYRADDALAEAQLWKQKQLSEEQERHKSHSRRKKDGPSNVSKKKHQITYLAHQAKEREIEYKNMWAQNQAARQFHRSKYGF